MTISTNGFTPLRRGEEEKEKEGSFLEDGMNLTNASQEPDRLQGQETSSYSSSGREDSALRLKQMQMARLLKSCGVRFYSQLSRSFPPDLIKARVEEWRRERAEGAELGPGMLVRMIQGGAPIIGDIPPIDPPAAQEPHPPVNNHEWLKRRSQLHQQGKRPSVNDYDFDDQGRLRGRRW